MSQSRTKESIAHLASRSESLLSLLLSPTRKDADQMNNNLNNNNSHCNSNTRHYQNNGNNLLHSHSPVPIKSSSNEKNDISSCLNQSTDINNHHALACSTTNNTNVAGAITNSSTLPASKTHLINDISVANSFAVNSNSKSAENSNFTSHISASSASLYNEDNTIQLSQYPVLKSHLPIALRPITNTLFFPSQKPLHVEYSVSNQQESANIDDSIKSIKANDIVKTVGNTEDEVDDDTDNDAIYSQPVLSL
jgi:hypothetical protein